jgi:hypothetical protein
MKPAAVVTGMIATYPVGGVLWDYGQYALGLERLGFDVWYLEDTGWESYDPRRGCFSGDYAYGVAFLAKSLGDLSPSLSRRWHVRAMDEKTYGVSQAELADVMRRANLFLNVSGGTLLRDEYLACPTRVLVDTDPGWNHFVNFPRWDAQPSWHDTHGYRSHNHFFTYAERLGYDDCALPTLGIRWEPTRPPVVLDCWHREAPGTQWTTVMTWDNFRRPITDGPRTYGTKEREFSAIETIPSRCQAPFEVAVGGAAPPIDRWRSIGWSVQSAEAVTTTGDDYRRYVQRSRGEFSVAKNVYVATRSGWFSCRSVCYLASGRPAVLQDTGFSDVIPTGDGLLVFSDLPSAVAALDAVECNYEHHARAARALAEEHFASGRVLGSLLERSGVALP